MLSWVSPFNAKISHSTRDTVPPFRRLWMDDVSNATIHSDCRVDERTAAHQKVKVVVDGWMSPSERHRWTDGRAASHRSRTLWHYWVPCPAQTWLRHERRRASQFEPSHRADEGRHPPTRASAGQRTPGTDRPNPTGQTDLNRPDRLT